MKDYEVAIPRPTYEVELPLTKTAVRKMTLEQLRDTAGNLPDSRAFQAYHHTSSVEEDARTGWYTTDTDSSFSFWGHHENMEPSRTEAAELRKGLLEYHKLFEDKS